jgi:hypothetical protein
MNLRTMFRFVLLASLLAPVSPSFAQGLFQTAWFSGNAETFWSATASGSYVGDFNGDSNEDVLQIKTGSGGAQNLLSNGDGSFAIAWTTDTGIFWNVTASRAFVGDFNGDGRSDVVQIKTGSGSARVLTADLSDGFVLSWSTDTGIFWNATASRAFVGDVNGDGFSDVVQIKTDSGSARTLLANADGSFAAAWISNSGVFWNATGSRGYMGDINGDGRADIVQIKTDSASARVLLANSDGSYVLAWTSPASGSGKFWNATATKAYPGDVNGDGYMDIVQIMNDTASAQVLLGSVDGSFTTFWTSPSSGSGKFLSGATAFAYIGDVNGDAIDDSNSRADVLQVRDDGNVAQLLLANADGSFHTAWNSPSSGSGMFWSAGQALTLLADVNGDGGKDAVQIWKDAGQGQVLLASRVAASVPGSPSFISVPQISPSNVSYNISWGAAVTGYVTHYEVQEGTEPTFTCYTTCRPGMACPTVCRVGPTVYSGPELSIDLTKSYADQYYYRVRACNGAGCSAYVAGANPISIEPAATVPGAPSSITVPQVSPPNVSYNISWGAAVTGPVTHYEVQEGTEPTFMCYMTCRPGMVCPTLCRESPVVYSGPELSVDLTKFYADQYYYRVRACNGADCSAYVAGANPISIE